MFTAVRSDSFTLHAYPPMAATMGGFRNWSLRPLQHPKDVERHPLLATALRVELRRLSVKHAYAPNVVPASAAVVAPEDLDLELDLGAKTRLFRKPSLPADGVMLPRGSAFIMSTSGCPLIIAEDDRFMVVAHASRDSLIERAAVEGAPVRAHPSIVDAIADWFHRPHGKLRMMMLFSIPRRSFGHELSHPLYGAYNRKLAAFIAERWPGAAVVENDTLYIDLPALFTEQARMHGAESCAGHSLAAYPRLSHTRDGLGTERRNLFIVRRNG